MKKLCLFMILIVLCSTLISGCTITSQIQSYTGFYVHDLRIVENDILVVFEKNTYSPKVSISAAMMSEMPTRMSYNHQDFILLSFDVTNTKKDTDSAKLIDAIKINKIRNFSGNILVFLIENFALYSNVDLVSGKRIPSIFFFQKKKTSNIVEYVSGYKYLLSSFDRKKIIYYNDKNIYKCSLFVDSSGDILLKNENTNFNEIDFKNTKYLLNDGETYLDYFYISSNLYHNKFVKINKKDSVVIGEINTDFRIFWDYQEDEDIILAYRGRLGLGILDRTGKTIYSLNDESIKTMSKAVFHKDKVYAAGIVTKEGTFGKSDYIEILQWDYKNGTTIRKYFPCDSPELEL